MARIDVTDALLDPDFIETNLMCERMVQSVGNDGLAVNTPTAVPFAGVVTSAEGNVLSRVPHGERVVGSITIHTRFGLVAGSEADELAADVVIWKSRRFTVSSVADYSHYGRGFIAARCEPIALKG